MGEIYTKGIIPTLFGKFAEDGGSFVLESSIPLIIGYILVVVAAYLLGSVNTAVIVSKTLFNDDVRRHGSGNAGTTNMLRTYDKRAAALTLIGDIMKAIIACLLGTFVFGLANQSVFAGGYVAGLACIIGHAFPAFYGFKGGKSVAVAAAMILTTSPLTFLIAFSIFLLIVASTKFMSMGAIAGMLLYPMILNNTGTKGMPVVIAVICSLLVIWLHRANIKRILNGTESKLDLKKKKEKKGTSEQDEKKK